MASSAFTTAGLQDFALANLSKFEFEDYIAEAKESMKESKTLHISIRRKQCFIMIGVLVVIALIVVFLVIFLK